MKIDAVPPEEKSDVEFHFHIDPQNEKVQDEHDFYLSF